MEFLIIIGSLLLSYILVQAIGKPKNLPPGPTRLPIIGNLHLLGDQPHQSLAKLAKTYGPIMSLKLGQITTLVISSSTAAKEVLQKQDVSFSNRYPSDSFHAGNHAQHSVAWLPVNSHWRTLRRLLSSSLFSTNSLEAAQHLRRQKVEELVAYCHKASLSKEYVNISRATFRTSLNLLSNIVFSKDLAEEREDSRSELKDAIGEAVVEGAKANIVDFFPVFKKLDPQGIRRRTARHFKKVLDAFEGLIEERLKIGSFKQNDALDMYLKFHQDNPNEFSRQHLHSLIMDVFGGGTDTTSSAVEWAMSELLRNPHVMTKAKEELEQVIGKGKIVQEDDVTRLPYLSCILKETLRLHPPAPFLFPRRVDKQVELNGYTIPKGTRVLVNYWAIGRDPTVWDEPLEFKPQRFIDSKIDLRGQDFDLIPFGAGRRICPGMSLALRTVPMILGSLLNNFDWSVDQINMQRGGMEMTDKFGISLSKAIPLCAMPVPLN